MGTLNTANLASNLASSGSELATTKAGTTTDTGTAISEINQAAEAENAINLATTMAQLKEAGPKNMKSLTQG